MRKVSTRGEAMQTTARERKEQGRLSQPKPQTSELKRLIQSNSILHTQEAKPTNPT